MQRGQERISLTTCRRHGLNPAGVWVVRGGGAAVVGGAQLCSRVDGAAGQRLARVLVLAVQLDLSHAGLAGEAVDRIVGGTGVVVVVGRAAFQWVLALFDALGRGDVLNHFTFVKSALVVHHRRHVP